jgi:hypothetical protein
MFAPQDQDSRRAGARGLTRSHSRAPARRLRRGAAGAVCAAAVTLPLLGAAAAQAATSTATFTPLTLVHGWTNYGSGTSSAAVASISGIVHLKGAIKTTGTNPVPFTLPAGDRPATKVYVPVDMCGATNGRLKITPTGVATVQAEGAAWGNAQCFTSLDGVSFAKSASSFNTLTLENGWTSYGYGTASPAARTISGIVHLKGAITTAATDAAAFVLPASLRPASRVSVPVDLCNATNGQLTIQPSGLVTVGAGSWSNAQCFTSLDGVSFGRSASSFTPLTLENGWTSYGFLFPGPAVTSVAGIVYLKGAIVTTGTNQVPFTLPAGFRPATTVYVKVSLGNAANGRLQIAPSGVVTVQAEGGIWSNAQSFTSLDGASFAP